MLGVILKICISYLSKQILLVKLFWTVLVCVGKEPGYEVVPVITVVVVQYGCQDYI